MKPLDQILDESLYASEAVAATIRQMPVGLTADQYCSLFGLVYAALSDLAAQQNELDCRGRALARKVYRMRHLWAQEMLDRFPARCASSANAESEAVR